YDAALLFDHEERRIWLSARGDAPATERLLRSLQHGCGPSGRRPAEAFLDSDCSRANYVATVETFIAQVLDGDFFQANLTRMIRARFRTDVSPFDLFRAMVAADPAPHAAFLRSDRGAAASISPERFFRIEPMADGRRVSAEPVKGTAPRRRDGERDRASAAALLASEKDRAENAMIVDLLRNDLAKVCREGTIEVPEFCALRSYAGVHHLTSRVEGVLRAGVGAAETMRALFPCGSITGAPKIEAMRAIRAVEGRGRGIYTGAIGYADDGGGADFSVAIRTAEIAVDARTEALYGVGGGVTMLSDPQAEYDETEAKAATFLRALAALSAGRAA
ncbi:MAG: anthranilate synthase component I family protein, partial [Pseudomonadota bacterium]